ncbi:hypothetical protein E2C01_045268 [Portunus trituberculatus]|uniref:Uncharacterized protein n=1 Tax=Portunus trituberculatus TaxID=210409 RepID=A0A5B7G2D8_PORTR|nr:hypothetical protein [Portunus trituberculatus]
MCSHSLPLSLPPTSCPRSLLLPALPYVLLCAPPSPAHTHTALRRDSDGALCCWGTGSEGGGEKRKYVEWCGSGGVACFNEGRSEIDLVLLQGGYSLVQVLGVLMMVVVLLVTYAAPVVETSRPPGAACFIRFASVFMYTEGG